MDYRSKEECVTGVGLAAGGRQVKEKKKEKQIIREMLRQVENQLKVIDCGRKLDRIRKRYMIKL